VFLSEVPKDIAPEFTEQFTDTVRFNFILYVVLHRTTRVYNCVNVDFQRNLNESI